MTLFKQGDSYLPVSFFISDIFQLDALIFAALNINMICSIDDIACVHTNSIFPTYSTEHVGISKEADSKGNLFSRFPFAQ